MASFMSGMAGNVTAFNTVWTYDIYQSYIRQNAPDSHYLGWAASPPSSACALSIGTAYLAQHYNNIMDLLQLVFGFVNAPLFATFLLGMFWKRATGHGAFTGLVSGTLAAAAYPRPRPWPKARAAGSAQPARVPLHHGAELLDRHLRLGRLLRGHHRGQPRRPSRRPKPNLTAWSTASRRIKPKRPIGTGARPPSPSMVAVVCIVLNFVFW